MIRIDRVHGGNPSDGVLDFSASINPLGPPRAALDTSMPGKFAIKIITERNCKRIAEFAFRLARKRKAA